MKRLLFAVIALAVVTIGIACLPSDGQISYPPTFSMNGSANISCTLGGACPITGVQGALVLTAQTANVGQGAQFITETTDGQYRLSCYDVVTTAATSSSTLPSFQYAYTDEDTAVASSWLGFGSTSTGNTVGTTANQGSVYFAAKNNHSVYVATTGYVSSGVTPMAYSLHCKLEYLGN